MAKYSIFATGIFILLFSFSCKMDNGGPPLAETLQESTPDTVLTSFIYTKSENGHKSYSIYAEKAMTFDKKNQTFLTHVVFQQFNEHNAIVTEGKADKGIIFTGNNNAEISGNIKIYSSREKAQIETSYLYWNNDKKTLTGKPGVRITITKDSGTVIRGGNFQGDMKTKTYTLDGGITGEYINEKK